MAVSSGRARKNAPIQTRKNEFSLEGLEINHGKAA